MSTWTDYLPDIDLTLWYVWCVGLLTICVAFPWCMVWCIQGIKKERKKRREHPEIHSEELHDEIPIVVQTDLHDHVEHSPTMSPSPRRADPPAKYHSYHKSSTPYRKSYHKPSTSHHKSSTPYHKSSNTYHKSSTPYHKSATPYHPSKTPYAPHHPYYSFPPLHHYNPYQYSPYYYGALYPPGPQAPFEHPHAHDKKRKKYKSSRKTFHSQNKKRKKKWNPPRTISTDFELPEDVHSLEARSRVAEEGSLISDLPRIPRPKQSLPNIQEIASLADSLPPSPPDEPILVVHETHSAPASPRETPGEQTPSKLLRFTSL